MEQKADAQISTKAFVKSLLRHLLTRRWGLAGDVNQ